ncbi:MAG: hypothetical protein EBS01_01500 [Verrucomicrobia bacterium]|nr:hypothetical protein [Verrucomicrobiota bacterium]
MKQSPRSDKPLWIAVFCTILAFLVFLYTGRAPEQLDGREHSSPATAPDAAQPGSEPPQSKEAAPQPASPSATKPTSQSAQLPAAQAPEVLALRNWLQEFTQLSPDQRETALPEGIALARERRPVMRELIRSNPEAALQQAMRFDEWEALPTAIKAEVERPFSETIKYSLFPTCPGPGSAPNVSPNAQKPLIQVQLGNGEVVNGFIYGGRAAINSKEGLPAQGIALDGMAALWDGVFLALSAEEAAIVETKFPAGQPDPKRSFVTGESVTGEAVTALAGGKRFTFANTEELLKFDAAIAKLDAKPGPYAGSRAIFSLPYSTAAASGNVTALPFNMAAAEMQAADLAADWTTTAKKVFLIRVVLSGTSNTSLASKSEAETVLSGTVSPSIYKFSYGKTSVNATVSAGTYLLDSSASYYSGTMPSDTTAAGTFTSNSDTLLADAKAKFRSLQLTKGDGGINIGTVDGGVSSGSYDIVGVIFTDIGMYKGGAKYAGLASIGGRDLWIQGNNSPVVYVHEMGHLYGLDHANFWLTTDASVVGTGVEKEYGDPFDVMGSGTLPNGHFHPQAKQRLSWLTSGQYADAPASGSNLYRIYQHDVLLDRLPSG